MSIYLGFDFGMQYIGVAVGQAITASANALMVIKAKQGVPDWSVIDTILKKWQAQAFVVGIPYQLDGSEQPISLAARQFAEQLRARYHLPVHLMDERLTTREARMTLAQQPSLARRIHRVDSYAAKLILESWLRAHQAEIQE